MPRLRELRERVKSITAYKADSVNFHNDVDGDLNDALEEVWTSKVWTFRVRSVSLEVPPDIVGGASLTVSNDSRYVENVSIDELYPDRHRSVRTARSWVGQVLTVHGRDYPILDVQAEGGDDAIILAEPIRLETGESTTVTEWTLKFVRVPLPVDCAEVLGLVDAATPITSAGAGGRVPGLPARRAEELDLRYDVTGPPCCYVPLEPVVVPGAGRTTAAWASSGGAANDANGFTVNRWYELTWGYAIGGRVGPLAEPVVIEAFPAGATAGSITVALFAEDGVTAAATDAADYTRRPYPLAFEGAHKVLFFNANLDPTNGERKGLPSWRAVTRRSYLTAEQEFDAFPLEVEDTASTVVINQAHQVNAGNARLARDPDGVHQQIRLYPRPATADASYPAQTISAPSPGRVAPKIELKAFQLRYLARPPLLSEPSDTPPLPTEFHQILTWKAAATMLRRCQDPKMAAEYETRAAEKLKSLVTAHTVRADVVYVMGQGWNYGGGRGLPNNVVFTRES